MIAESTSIRNHAGMTDDQSKPPLRWFDRIWIGFVGSLFVCVATAGISMFLRFTLADSLSQRIEWGFCSGLFFGGLIFLLFVGPIQTVVILLLRWLKVTTLWRLLCSQLPAWTVFFYLINSSLNYLSPSGEQKWFQMTVGVLFPTNAKLVLAQHGLGFQDRRHLWLLEGDPSDFERLVIARGWVLNDDEPFQMADQGIRRAREHFDKSAPWQPDLTYFWEADKDATKGPFGMIYLLADKDRKRWAVWVMD